MAAIRHRPAATLAINECGRLPHIGLPRTRLYAHARYASPTRTPDVRIGAFQDEAARRPSDGRGRPTTMMRCFVSWTPPGSHRVTIGVPGALFDTYPRAISSHRSGGVNSALHGVIRAASVAAAYQQDQELVQTAGGEKGGHAAHIMRRANRVDIEGDETQPLQRSDQCQALTGRHTAPSRRAHARRAGRIEEIHVEA